MPATAVDGSRAVKTLLGHAARGARRAGLERSVAAVRDAVDAALLRLDAPVLSAPAGDRRIRGFLRHRSFLAEIDQGDYEPALRSLILESAGEGSLFLDVGAHVGYYSVLAARAGSEVIAVEPDPYNYAALRKNVRGLRVDAQPTAVGDVVGRARFHPSESTTGSSLLARRDIPLRGSIEVPTTTVDTLVAGRVDRPIVLKLDVEGAEPLALAGAADVLRRADRIAVIAEVNPAALATNGYSIEDITRPLGEYELEFVDRTGRIGPVPHTPTKGNLVARRPGDARRRS